MKEWMQPGHLLAQGRLGDICWDQNREWVEKNEAEWVVVQGNGLEQKGTD